MSNIFEGAKFGDKYITRAGNIALFYEHNDGGAVLFYEDGNTHRVNYDGCYHDLSCFVNPGDYLTDIDIVCRYREHVDIDVIVKLASKCCPIYDRHVAAHTLWCMGFEEGYRKAKEE